MGAAHTHSVVTNNSTTKTRSDIDSRVSDSAVLSSSHPARIQNPKAQQSASTSQSLNSSSTLASSASISVPVSPMQLSSNMKGVHHHPNAATFLRLAALGREQQQRFNETNLSVTQKDHTFSSSPCTLPPLPTSTSDSTPCTSTNPPHRRARTSVGNCLKGHKPRNLRLSLLPCVNCSRLCQPDVLSRDGKLYCSGECYFSAAFRGENQKIRNLYDQVFANDLDSIIEEQTTLSQSHQQTSTVSVSADKTEEENDEYLQSCKRRARQLQENGNFDTNMSQMKTRGERPSLVTSRPIRIPLPHPDYVPY